MNQKNKSVKRKQKLSIKHIVGGGEIAPIKITEVIDLFLEIYSHPEYSAHLIEFFSDFKKEYGQLYPFEDIEEDIVVQEQIVKNQQQSLKKSDYVVREYVSEYFNEIKTRKVSPYTHKENIQALINGKYYYKPMISKLVFIALNNVKKFITDRQYEQFNKIITIHITKIIFDILHLIIKNNMLEKSTFFEDLNKIIATQYRNIKENEQSRENNEALERIEKLLLQILYTLIHNIIDDNSVKVLYLSIIRDKINENEKNEKSLKEIIEHWKTTILCYLEHSKDFVELLTKDNVIELITHLISNKQVFNDITPIIYFLFGNFSGCNFTAIKTGIQSFLSNIRFGWSQTNIKEEYKNKLTVDFNNIPKLNEQQKAIYSSSLESIKLPKSSTLPESIILPESNNSHTRTIKRRPFHWAAKRLGFTRKQGITKTQ